MLSLNILDGLNPTRYVASSHQEEAFPSRTAALYLTDQVFMMQSFDLGCSLESDY